MPATLFRLVAAASAVACVSSLAQVARAQASYPGKPIRLMVGSPPGAPSDVTARVFAESLSQRFKQPVVVENRPGAGNNLAAGLVANAEPDGYTLGLSPDTVLTVNPHVYRSQSFDARKDLVSVSILASFTQMLVCNPETGAKTLAELIARARNTRITYASGGAGVPGHLAAEMFLQTAGVKMDHVPYRGPSPATVAVLSGEVNCGFLATPTVIQHVKTGKLNALAVSSKTPSPLAPDVPTLASALNQSGLDVSFKLVLQAPRGTPAPVIAELERASRDIMANPAVRARLQGSDLVAQGTSAADADRGMRAEIDRWEPLVKRLELKAD